MSRCFGRAPSRSVLLLASTMVVLLTSALAEGWEPVAITDCGQEFAGAGYLTRDLDCLSTTGPAVLLNGTGSLDLAGFSITSVDAGVICAQSCSITGPGTISAVAGNGISAAGALKVTGVDVIGNGGDGVVGYQAVRVVDSLITGNGASGVRSQRLVIRSSFVSGNGNFGAVGGLDRRVVLRDSQVVGNGMSPECALGAPCADIAAGRRPRLRHSLCNTSWDSRSLDGANWQVCFRD